MRVVPPQPSAGFAAVLLAGLAACSPSRTGPADPAPGGAGVTYGTIVGARAVTARGVPPGAGPAPGDVAGTVGGRDWRSPLIAGLGGWAIATGPTPGATTRDAVEFLVREEGGRDLATVQANGDGLTVGQRVAIIRGDRTRLARPRG